MSAGKVLWYWNQITRLTAHNGLLRCLLGDGLRGEGLGIPSPQEGCRCSCCRGKSGSGECGLLPGAVRGGRRGVVGFFRLLGGERGVWECRFLSGLPFYSVASGAGGHRAPVMDVSVIIQLMFLQYFEKVPQIPSSTECCRFQLYYRGESVQCKLCKSRRFHSAVLGQVVHAPVVMLRQVFGVGQCRKTVEVPQLQSVQFLEVIDMRFVLVKTGACVGPDSAEFVEILQFWTRLLVCRWCAETVEALELQFIDSLVHVLAVMQRLVPMVQTVQLGLEAWVAHLLDDELWIFLGPCTQVQGWGSCPQGHGPLN